MSRYIDADKLKQHYAWWDNEYTSDEMKEQKKVFDTIIDLQPTVDIDKLVEERKESEEK